MIKLFFMDVDGTLTDGKIYISSQGELFKAFDVKDGYAIKKIMNEHNIVPVVITSRSSPITKYRCEELSISEVYQGCDDKEKKMIEVAKKYGIELENGILKNTAYIGDDLPDLSCIKISEYSACPSDAHKEVIENASYVCSSKGGMGAVREFVELLLVKCYSNN